MVLAAKACAWVAKVREAGRLLPIPFSPLSSHFEMTGMAFNPHSLLFLPVQLHPF